MKTTPYRMPITGLVMLFIGQCGAAQHDEPLTRKAADSETHPVSAESARETDAGTGEVFANVTAVTAAGDPGAYTFDVTVESADTGCSQYADWWEVASETGALLYRRILAHSHTEKNGAGNPFTRSGGPVPVTADQTVIVRAHMSTVGYRGQVMTGTVQDGFVPSSDAADGFAADLAAAAPLPDGCSF
jgi:hypothetical protein